MFIGPHGINSLVASVHDLQRFENPIFGLEQAEISDVHAGVHNLDDLPISVVQTNSSPLGVEVVATLEDVFDHPALYAAYPQLKKTGVARISGSLPAVGSGSFFNQGGGIIVLNVQSGFEAVEDVVHEIQHAVQSAEGYNSGSPSVYALKLPPYLQKVLLFASPIEREARNAVARMNGSSKVWFRESAPGLGEPASWRGILNRFAKDPVSASAYSALLAPASQKELQKAMMMGCDRVELELFYRGILNRLLGLHL